MTSAADDWNRAIGTAFFRSDQAGERVVLAIDEAELFRIAQDSGLAETFGLADPHDATEHLCVAVREQIAAHSWQPTPCDKDRLPPFIALLAVFVLAMFRMKEEESRSKDAYWIRVLDLLEPEDARQARDRHRAGERFQDRLPRGLDHPTFRDLWQKVEEWANRIQGCAWGRFELPPLRSGPHSSVRIVKSQALLRREDLAHLPRFFALVGLQPGARLSTEESREAVMPHRTDDALFSAHAQRVLADDERLTAAAKQIARRLERWDGTHEAAATAPPRRHRSRFDPWRQPDETVDPVRLIGGLKLDDGTWMAGAGPTLLVEDESLAALPRREAWIDGVSWPLEDGRLGPDQAPILDRPGLHEVRVGARRLVLKVAEPHLAAAAWQAKPAWRARTTTANVTSAWPEPEEGATADEEPSLEGPWLEGSWADRQRPETQRPPLARRWVESALAVRGGGRKIGGCKGEDQPLRRQLHAAAAG